MEIQGLDLQNDSTTDYIPLKILLGYIMYLSPQSINSCKNDCTIKPGKVRAFSLYRF